MSTPGDQGVVLDIALNAEAVDSLNAAGAGSYAIGSAAGKFGGGGLSLQRCR